MARRWRLSGGLAAVYGYGLVKNHCFLDGNKIYYLLL
ncbi:MAG: Fic family protein [Dethiobacteria bacterium]